MTLNCVSNPIQAQGVKSPKFGKLEKEKNNVDNNSSSFGLGKAALTLATLGAITYGVIRYRNAKALKPLVKTIETNTKNGCKIINQITQSSSQNPDGTTTNAIVKSVKTQLDKNGIKRAEIIHNYETRECYSTFYDKDGKVVKNVVSRLSEPASNGRYFVNQKMTHTMTYGDNFVTTQSTLRDFTNKKKPDILYTNTKVEQLNNNNMPVKLEN